MQFVYNKKEIKARTKRRREMINKPPTNLICWTQTYFFQGNLTQTFIYDIWAEPKCMDQRRATRLVQYMKQIWSNNSPLLKYSKAHATKLVWWEGHSIQQHPNTRKTRSDGR